jgi:HD-like signal output (HDOD) protein
MAESFVEIVDHHLKSSNVRLPVFSATALRIQQEIAKEEPDIRLIEKMIVSDQSLTAKVLSTSNSSFYKGLTQVSTVRNAIVRMGVNEVSNIVMLVSHENNFRSKDPFLHNTMRRLWRHALDCAMAAHWLAKTCGLQALIHEAFFAGLLHDVGKLFILSVIDDLKNSGKMDIPFSNALLVEAMNSLHTGHGSTLLNHWNLPQKYCGVAQKHHDQAFDANDFLLVLVRLADKACNKIGIGLTTNESVVLVATPEANSLNLSDVDLAKLEIMLEDSQVSDKPD